MSEAKYLIIKKNNKTGEIYTVYENSDAQLASHIVACEDTKYIILSITNLQPNE